jgi:hypothetical protein
VILEGCVSTRNERLAIVRAINGAPLQQPVGRSRFDGIDQAASIVGGRVEGGYAGAFELICCECGGNP